MPKCKNDKEATYKGTEPSPKGKGYAAHAEKEGTVMKGKDGNEWEVKKASNGTKRWVKKDSDESEQSDDEDEDDDDDDDDDKKEEKGKKEKKTRKRKHSKEDEESGDDRKKKAAKKEDPVVTIIEGLILGSVRPKTQNLEEKSEKQRKSDIKKLGDHARRTILRFLREGKDDEVPEDMSLEELLRTFDDADDVMDFCYWSPDWRLVTFKNDDGTFYDWNGWPGDNENGFGVFCPKKGNPIEVFRNSDTSLSASEERFTDLVKRYEQARNKRLEKD
eukprot:TRINITY_DN3314_c0_g1_i3.p1 TRINITY_DN3314_c0_g1~~TRINITY_DN3314_c0_g1_i3.p1  ORF type:complete len:275 (-),score=90.79 TRINITY_DN3314_c0_g1_i3:55-879(-)